jgi:hypothetical protein
LRRIAQGLVNKRDNTFLKSIVNRAPGWPQTHGRHEPLEQLSSCGGALAAATRIVCRNCIHKKSARTRCPCLARRSPDGAAGTKADSGRNSVARACACHGLRLLWGAFQHPTDRGQGGGRSLAHRCRRGCCLTANRACSRRRWCSWGAKGDGWDALLA